MWPPFALHKSPPLQVIANFVSNAVKFSPAGSRVSVRAELLDSVLVAPPQDAEAAAGGPAVPRQRRRWAACDCLGAPSATEEGSGGWVIPSRPGAAPQLRRQGSSMRMALDSVTVAPPTASATAWAVQRAIGEVDAARFVRVARGGERPAAQAPLPSSRSSASAAVAAPVADEDVTHSWVDAAALDDSVGAFGVAIIEIAVADTGCGVSGPDALRLFEAFQQVR